MTVSLRRSHNENVRLVVALGSVLVLVALAVRVASEPSSALVVEAMRELGPISGWRCAQGARGAYVYDPRRERPDSTLFAERPEVVIQRAIDGVEVERVEADLRGGDTVVWSLVAAQRRVYVLSPGRQRAIGLDLVAGRAAICQSELGDWQVVAEHTLE
jgi:hypothetical protein